MSDAELADWSEKGSCCASAGPQKLPQGHSNGEKASTAIPCALLLPATALAPVCGAVPPLPPAHLADGLVGGVHQDHLKVLVHGILGGEGDRGAGAGSALCTASFDGKQEGRQFWHTRSCHTLCGGARVLRQEAVHV